MRVPTLKRAWEIEEVIAQGKRVPLGDFVIYFQSQTKDPTPRLAIQVSRKVGNAIRRNRIRRLVKETCRHTFPRFAEGIRFVVIARMGATKRSYQETKAILERFFETQGFLKPIATEDPSPTNEKS